MRSRPIHVDRGWNWVNSSQNLCETSRRGLTWNNLRRGEEIIDSGILVALLPFRWHKRNSLRSPGNAQVLPAWLQLRLQLTMALAMVLLLASVAFLGGCGGGGSSRPPTGTPAGTFMLTVTATSNGASHSTQLTLTVQ